ncbi:cysteine proteinase [Cucurbitaria berberidis CBS 394.84]|uniref:Cysteine proteinase n=1 Tax=Cucurbitaria berberidis CBS 394.84 TaxID=1168544 RepID=A0A9P4GJF9_9PLEO|nr:cysteine proteinase [Cucurbitaria berberidis CBS 394.84]KAF1846752.1 cysteine proteinase [Cucurbitaria berberidis CBS 394.84]
MSKRAFESAFSARPGGLLVTADGFGALQPQVQQLLPVSRESETTSTLHVPGQWPLESQFTECDDAPTVGGGSFFTTIGTWAATVTNITNIFQLPARLAQRYLRQQTICAVPVVRKDGSIKKRLVDAGHADEPTTPSPSARAHANLKRRRFPQATTLSPDLWSPSPSPVQSGEGVLATLPAVNDFDDDDSLEFSFTDLLTSTPPRNARTGSPIPCSWDSPQIHPNGPTFQPAPVTPMRRHLLKLQLRAHVEHQDAREERIADADAQTPELETALYEDSELPIPLSSPFQTDVSSSPFQTDVESSPFQSHISSDQPPAYENDLSFLSDAPSPPRKKSVRWAQHAGAKSFFIDERVSEMLDSTLETITSNLQEDLKKKLALAPPPSPPPPVKPLVLPLSSEELDALDAVVAQTDHGRNANMYVIPEKLYARDFGTLLPEQFNGDPKAWLNDNIVNEYLAILVAHKKKEIGFAHKRGGPAPPVHAFSSFWYSTIKDRPKSVERWASRFQLGGRQYLDADLVLYPICDGGHWRLLAVKPKERIIEYLDSLGFSGQKYVVKLKEYLSKELGDAWVEEDWTTVELQRSSQQLNSSDCGVFTLLNALTVLRGEEAQRVVACCGMTDARERIATTLLAGHPTTELE